MNQDLIRNFCIIAHIDHGKSTLADRMLEITGTVDKRKMVERTLDSMDLEKEKGITIKLKAVRMDYKGYQLNLIDTPGHVDFSYEVSRSLAACEGAVLLVDASQGIQAQTVSNIYKALDANLHIIPVLNKIDLPGAETDKVIDDMIKTFGFKKEEILKVSGKTGFGVEDLLNQIVSLVPRPNGDINGKPRALIFDTLYDDYLGVLAAIKVVDGVFDEKYFQSGKKIYLCATHCTSRPEGIGYFSPQRVSCKKLSAGEVGFISTSLKNIKEIKVGDTICLEESIVDPLPGYKEVLPFVFVSIFPIENHKFKNLREALEKLCLSDSSLIYEPESSSALGFGFRCGFLGLLHAEIIQERLEREYNLELISTIPTVEYKVHLTNGEEIFVKAASNFPDRSRIKEAFEPWIHLNIVSPATYIGNILTLCEDRRGILIKMEYPTEDKVIFEYDLPLSELVYNFFDDLKSVSSGFASLDYELSDYRKADVVKMDVVVHGDIIEPLSHIVLLEKSMEIGKSLVKKLKDVIPRQQFKVAIQASVSGKIVAREDLPALRKDVLAKMSGGHRERKDKLLDIQKKGKERMKHLGKVDIPQEAFRQILKA